MCKVKKKNLHHKEQCPIVLRTYISTKITKKKKIKLQKKSKLLSNFSYPDADVSKNSIEYRTQSVKNVIENKTGAIAKCMLL